MRKIIGTAFLLWCGFVSRSQVNMSDRLKEKANQSKARLKEKGREKATESLEKQRKAYDESNFNYAICFLDNSGTFESEEKGMAFSNTLLNLTKWANDETKSVEERAYTNLRNGELLMAGNKYYLAEQSFKLAKLLYEEDGKSSSASYAQTLSNLGLLYQSRGRYNRARTFNEQALSLRESLGNKGMIIVSVNNNAVLKKETGLYVEAERDLKKALEMARTANDKLAEALIQNNLAMTYLDMNKLKDAEARMDQSLAAAATVMKENAENYIKLQINLANVYRFEKKYGEAEALYQKAIAVKEKKLGAHPDLAHLKKGLAQLYMDMGKTEEVERLLVSAYDINKRKLGEKNPATVAVQQELANFYRFTGNKEKAGELIQKVVASKKEIYGEAHPVYIQSLEDLALTQWQNARIHEARANYQTVMDNTLAYIHSFFDALNENEKTLYWEKTGYRLQRYYSFIHNNYKENPELVLQFYNTLINTKGFLWKNSAKIRHIIYSSGDEALKQSYTQWLETKENLNQAYQLSKEELVQERINLDSLSRRADELERELSRKSALFKSSLQEAPLSGEAVQKALKPGEYAVEIVELNTYKNGFTGKQYYLALVITATEIKLTELGEGESIQKAIQSFRERVTELKPAGDTYGSTWKVLDEQIKGCSRLYLSLDGAYHQLSINGLKEPAGKYLVDKYQILFMGNTKDLLDIKQQEKATLKPGTAFLVGNPAYGKSGVIDQLPGTEAEVKQITRLLTSHKVKTTALYGKEATEARIKQLDSPGILHIATHGYFLADLSRMETSRVLGVDIAAARENPLLRSGLLFASCDNVFEEDYRPSVTEENGILTAYEAMSLNLDKTDMVVLSACETGLGNIRQGEGVYGLQRAFLIAGARSIVMSLWSVSDEATMQLMTLFYNNYAKTGNKIQAFSEAVKQLKLKYKDPFYWAAFVMLNK